MRDHPAGTQFLAPKRGRAPKRGFQLSCGDPLFGARPCLCASNTGFRRTRVGPLSRAMRDPARAHPSLVSRAAHVHDRPPQTPEKLWCLDVRSVQCSQTTKALSCVFDSPLLFGCAHVSPTNQQCYADSNHADYLK